MSIKCLSVATSIKMDLLLYDYFRYAFKLDRCQETYWANLQKFHHNVCVRTCQLWYLMRCISLWWRNDTKKVRFFCEHKLQYPKLYMNFVWEELQFTKGLNSRLAHNSRENSRTSKETGWDKGHQLLKIWNLNRTYWTLEIKRKGKRVYFIVFIAKALQAMLYDMISIQILNKINKTRFKSSQN